MRLKSHFAAIAGLLCAVVAAAPLDEAKKDEDGPVGGTTSKYKLVYESEKGKDGKAIYRVKNQPGGLATPVLWKDDKIVLVDCIVPKCGENDKCSWNQYWQTYTKAVKGETDLSYGINQDEHKDQAMAWRKSRDEMAKGKLESGMNGQIANKEGKVYDIDVTVSSSIKGQNAVYNLRVGQKGAKLAFEPKSNELKVIWHSPDSKLFRDEILKQKINMLSDKPTTVELRGSSAFDVKYGLLEIQENGKKIAAMTAPAYVPKD